MARWLAKVLSRVHALAATGRVRLTYKAQREMAAMGFSPEDVRDVLVSLAGDDSVGRTQSMTTGEWMYIFKPGVGEHPLYVKLILRLECVVVSFHEDEADDEQEGE
jgi:hypothetical protein